MSALTGSEELNQITQEVIGCLYTVSNTLGGGLLERVDQNAAALEIAKTGLAVRQQYPICVKYDGVTDESSRAHPGHPRNPKQTTAFICGHLWLGLLHHS